MVGLRVQRIQHTDCNSQPGFCLYTYAMYCSNPCDWAYQLTLKRFDWFVQYHFLDNWLIRFACVSCVSCVFVFILWNTISNKHNIILINCYACNIVGIVFLPTVMIFIWSFVLCLLYVLCIRFLLFLFCFLYVFY